MEKPFFIYNGKARDFETHMQELLKKEAPAMSRISSFSVGHPTQEKPGLWFVIVSADNTDYRLYFDVAGNAVRSFYESPKLQAIFPQRGPGFTFGEVVGKGYRILQDHVAQEDAPAYSFGYRIATGLIQQRFAQLGRMQ